MAEVNDLARDLFPASPVGRAVSSLFAEGAALPDAPSALAGWLGEGRPLSVAGATGQVRFQARASAWENGGLVVLVSLAVEGPREIDVDLLAQAVDAADNAVVIADVRHPDAPLVYANEYFLRFTGYETHEVIGRNCRFLQMHRGEYDNTGDGQEEALDRIRHGIAHAEPVPGVVLRNYRKDGTLFYNELFLTPVRDAAGVMTHIIGVQNDVTSRIEAMRERMQAAERLQSLFSAAAVPLGLLERTPDGELLHVLHNDASRDALGLGGEGGATLEAIGEDAVARWMAAAESARRSGEPVRFDVSLDGDDRTFEVFLSPVRPDAEPDAPERFLYLAADVTSGRAAVEDLLHVSNHQMKRIAQDIHDGLGQSLTGAAMIATALARDLQGTPQAADGARLRDLLIRSQSQLRSFALGLDPVDLDRLGMGEALGRLAADAQEVLRVDVVVEDRLAGLHLHDEAMLDFYRIAQEALTNAARHGRARTVRLALDRAEDDVVLAIEDDGHGIQLTRPNNDGMGLRTMRARAQRHGGTLAIAPRAEGGTRVELSTPAERVGGR